MWATSLAIFPAVSGNYLSGRVLWRWWGRGRRNVIQNSLTSWDFSDPQFSRFLHLLSYKNPCRASELWLLFSEVIWENNLNTSRTDGEQLKFLESTRPTQHVHENLIESQVLYTNIYCWEIWTEQKAYSGWICMISHDITNWENEIFFVILTTITRRCGN